MAVHLITGFKGEEHIQSADQGSFNASFFGDGEFVMEAGNQCEASILDNNTVRVLDGDILMQGRHIRIPSNTYIDVTIRTGTAGVNRNDMIVMEYSKDAGTGIETADLKVIQGVASEGTATDPSVATGDILGGATLNQMPLYRVKVEGVVLSAVEPMFTTIPTYKKLAEEAKKEFKESCENHLNSLNILETKEEIQANTQANQLAGALAVKEVVQDLTASDGTEFRFGVNEAGKYGYIVTDSEGADTVIPFSNKDELYEALQYSGLVTEDMTYEEMLEALAAFFPESFNLLEDEVDDYTVSSSGSAAIRSFTKTEDGHFKMEVKGPNWDGNYAHLYASRKEVIDLTRYSKFEFVGTHDLSSDTYAAFEVSILDASSQAVLATQKVPNGTFAYEIDISSINVECIIRYHGSSTKGNSYSYVTITKAKLLA